MIPLRLEDAPSAQHRLVVAANGEWFQLDDSPIVTLETRIPLRRLLVAMAENKGPTATGQVLNVAAAFRVGWPGERASASAAAMRVYTAIHTLRRMGLKGLIVRRRRGYTIDAEVILAKNESQIPPAMPSSATTMIEGVDESLLQDEPLSQVG